MARTPKAQPKKLGRPSDFSQDIADRICDRISDGESLRSICTTEDMPRKSTVFRWLAAEENKAFRDQYAHAREAQADALVDDMLDIADDARNDWMLRHGGDGEDVPIINTEHIQRSKLRIDARKWMAEKMAPKKYGAKADLNLSGGLTVSIAPDHAKLG